MAHHIREFEIQLYWQRALYFWGFQAALFAVAALMLSDLSNDFLAAQLFGITIISVLAGATSVLWVIMTLGAKFWQDNWERHVDLLEKEVCGNLYKVYPIADGYKGAPFSVSKVNLYFIYIVLLFWAYVYIISGIWAISELEGQTSITLAISMFLLPLLGLFFFVMQFRSSKAYLGMRMSEFGEVVYTEEGGPADDTPTLVLRAGDR